MRQTSQTSKTQQLVSGYGCKILLFTLLVMTLFTSRFPVTANNSPSAGSGALPLALARIAPGIKPANPNASPTARSILEYLHELPGKPSQRVIVGQFGSYGTGAGVPQAESRLQKIYDQTGKWPALTGMDYHTWDRNHLHDLSIPNGYLIEQWNKGSLVDVSWHAPNPWSGGEATDCGGVSCKDPKAQSANVRELITPGTKVNKTWIGMLDNIASGLAALQDAGVVVIWRPFHEMNGGWFWWGKQKPADFSALWQHMFNYFTYTKGLNNLLWAYAPNTNNNKWNKSTSYFYPGAEYVDIVGVDKYMEIGEDPLKLNDWHEYTDLIALDKPFGLFEFGPSPALSTPDRPMFDYTKLIRDIRAEYPQTVFFQAWEWHFAIGEHLNASALMHDPWVITRDDLPDWKNPGNPDTTSSGNGNPS